MKLVSLVLASLGVLLLVAPGVSMAQTSEPTMDETVRQFDEIIKAREQAARSNSGFFNTRTSLPGQVADFLKAIPRLREAVGKFQLALSFGNELGTSAAEIGKETDVVLRYLRWRSSVRQRLNSSELEKLSTEGRAKEMLVTAARVSPYLEHVGKTERGTTVPVELWETLGELEKEAMRLKWLTSHLK